MSTIRFIAERKCFINGDYEYCPVLDVIQDYPPERFSIVFLYNNRNDYGENSIYQVMVMPNIRIGWIFPGQALFSNQHDYAGDKYFRKYAYVALYKILEYNNEIDENEVSQKVLLVIDLQNTQKITDFNIEDYVISLYSRGYTFSGRGNYFSIDTISSSERKLKLKPISSVLKKKSYYIHNLFKNYIPNAVDPISVFLLFYQIFEIMISIIFDETFYKILNRINNNNNIDLQGVKEKLIESTSEKSRIKRLFSEKTKIESNHLNTLKESCERLLATYHQTNDK